MKNFIEEFKQFAIRGNMIDLAVGIIIGGAFQKIVSSFVNDIALAALSPLMGGDDFAKLHFGPLNIGNFLGVMLDFIIVAFFVFLLVKTINTFRKTHTKKEDLSKQEQLLTEIRDLLKK
ncbi:MAG TPA: large conductance mechanosensitive channel protein MscL [Candidatus Paceibacterota bacterium]|jgi:large conductance mechanosensitive channel|nr:large conductance mechanosensitive channel protein MscL [Candidatus Paceibacterota bacterium]